jgi:hypothetical protein
MSHREIQEIRLSYCQQLGLYIQSLFRKYNIISNLLWLVPDPVGEELRLVSSLVGR